MYSKQFVDSRILTLLLQRKCALYTNHCTAIDVNFPSLCGLVVRVPGYRSRCPGFDYRRYQVFGEVVSLERGSLSLVSTIEELLGIKSSDSGLENREYGRRDLS
jgi:hypothetical protein